MNREVVVEVQDEPVAAGVVADSPVIRQFVSDYAQLTNPPSINQHVLTAGENSLAQLGISRASTADVNQLFR